MENKEGFRSYSIKRRKGIDDLIGEYAWIGNSQGDESYTNDINVGKGSDGWMSYVFKDIDINDQEAINKESERRKQVNKDYIKELKRTGEYGKEGSPVTLHLKHNPLFDR